MATNLVLRFACRLMLCDPDTVMTEVTRARLAAHLDGRWTTEAAVWSWQQVLAWAQDHRGNILPVLESQYAAWQREAQGLVAANRWEGSPHELD